MIDRPDGSVRGPRVALRRGSGFVRRGGGRAAGGRGRGRPGRGWAGTAAALLALSACETPPPPPLPPPTALPLLGHRIVHPFPMMEGRLTDVADGAERSLRGLAEDRVTLLFFGYTFCPDICPIQMATLGAALDELGPGVRDRLRTVFVTVDPERDTAERVRTWLSAFDSSFVGLRGTEEEVYEILGRLNFPRPTRSAEGPVYTVGHPAEVYAFGADRLAYATYGPDTRRATWVHDLPLLVGYPWDDRAGAGEGAAHAAAGAPSAGDVRDGGAPAGGRVGSLELSGGVVAAAPPGEATAAYVTISNRGALADTLVRISAAGARVSVHRTETGDGLATMESVGRLEIPARGRAAMAPGGLHLMLEDGPAGGWIAGTRVPLTLTFGRAGTVALDLPVVPRERIPR